MRPGIVVSLTLGLGSSLFCCLLMAPYATIASANNKPMSQPLNLELRSRSRDAESTAGPRTQSVQWDPAETAIVVCDMWDRHWCRSAERRVGELVPAVNRFLDAGRARGVLVIHAPSSVVDFYEQTPARSLAKSAPFAPTPSPLSTSPRWGTAWCWTDGKHEGVLPIDDSDMGCDCAEKCPIEPPWTRQHPDLRIADGEPLTDNGQETWNLLESRGIKHVLICGVHLNMCVLGRPFGIRQLTRLGKDVVLVRDLTDTMYNPERPPGVSHFAGTQLMIEHVERYWCPSIESTALTGKPAFRFAGDPQ